MLPSSPSAASAQRRPVLLAPVDISFLTFFRIFFAVMMLWALWEFHSKGLIASVYVRPSFHFTFHGFAWLRPWPGDGMYLHFAGLAVLALSLMAGLFSRTSAWLLGVGFLYVFLLEKAVYLNHHYLMCLFCLLLAVLPAGRAWSLDTLLWPGWRLDTVPAWTLWLLRFQVGLPYFYGGLAKLQGDWLQGQPMQLWLSRSVWRVSLGPVAEERWLALLFSWGGLLFDLAVVPLLLWKRTRVVAFTAVIVFHLMNAFMFDIGVFPWLMIGATAVFFPPDWPRRLLDHYEGTASRERQRPEGKRSPARSPDHVGTEPPAARTTPTRGLAILLALYVLVQLVVPFHRWLYPGNVLWTNEGYHFSWHMMLRAKVNAIGFRLTDRATGKIEPLDVKRWLTPQQLESMGHDPEMLREFAEFVRRRHAEKGQDVEVRVVALCSLNGRKPQSLIDPAVDLGREPRRWLHQPYIVPLTEPFRYPPWNVPIGEWEQPRR